MIGTVLHILYVITLMIFDVLSRHIFLKNNGYNATVQCIFHESYGTLSTSFSNYWMALPNFLYMLSLILLLIGMVEFIAAQAPYSMKGLILGAQYTLTLFFAAIESILYYTLFNRKLFIWGTGTVSCGFCYALLALFVELSFYVLIVLKLYLI